MTTPIGLVKYEVAPWGTGDFTHPLTLAKVIQRDARLLREEGRAKQFRIRNWGAKPNSVKDDFWGPPRSYDEVLDISRNKLKMEELGYRHVIGVDDGTKVRPIITNHKIDAAPNIIDITGSPHIDIIYTFNVKTFRPHVANLGTWYCRYVDGTYTVSKHGYEGWATNQSDQSIQWFGAAIDFGPSGDMDFLETVFHYNIKMCEEGVFNNTGLILFKDLGWSPEQGLHQSGANYHYHVHHETKEGSPCNP